jgi:phosphoglycolate phosphatase-like HAD superfamily hydrolase
MREVVYVDVDDTLVRWAGSRAIPVPHVIAEVRRLHASGAELYCWSAAGRQAALEVLDGLRITSMFAAVLPKPTLLIDDRELGARRLRPGELPG